jgi:N-acetyl-anhydromuramyl-L-alanine amidase AmpD
LKIYTVAEWGGRRIDNSSLARKPAVGAVVHHTAGANRKSWADDSQFERDKAFQLARTIQADHMSTRGGQKVAWRDSGHHFLVTRGGLILEGRNGTVDAARKGLVIYGAHSGNTTTNGNRWGIECEGNTNEEPLTDAQWAALVDLLAHLSLWGQTQATSILGHREVKATECPGEWLFGLRQRKLALQGVPAPPPTAEAAPEMEECK